MVISGDTGMRKPDAAIYLIATDELGVPPRECVFADDTAANLPVAEELGMATSTSPTPPRASPRSVVCSDSLASNSRRLRDLDAGIGLTTQPH